MSHPAAREYEASDIHPRKVIWTAVVLIAAIALTHVIVYVLIAWLHGSSAGTPLRGNSVPSLPADLRQFVFAPIDAFREHERQTLDSYAWTDRAHAVAQIPIERAIDLYVQTHGGKPMGQSTAQAHCEIPTYTPGMNGCNLVFLPPVLEQQRAGSVTAPNGEAR